MNSKVSMKKRYLIILSGQGDTIINVVNEETWNYVGSPQPKFVDGYATETLPKGVKAIPGDDTTSGPTDTINVTSGSYINDRALLVKGERTFYTMTEYTTWVKKSKVKIADEYHGLIY